MICKDFNYPWRLYATPNISSIWQIKSTQVGEVIHHFYTQYIAQNIHKSCRIKRVKTLFRQTIRHKKL
jgi:hypothetical protein